MTDTAIELNIDDIQKRIPHRPPMLLIDRVESLVVDKSAVGIKMVSVSDHVFAVHFPDYPIMPGVLIVEAMAQTAGCLASVTLGDAAGSPIQQMETPRIDHQGLCVRQSPHAHATPPCRQSGHADR